ncbi:prepilin-type cleavage/methylation protein [Gallaecimonas xiamenensis 3-C-1]|uniref:Prepilin-type cleavage/methylation protein n=1 Tax=Gallaecimonas xiamenensis 3-C-1 TaxID=745411 RepID=K2IY33_9GAMM|nr:prepilin-type cleavage/methylation protein [Gallaecimonas xiamenensis 3-C-1]
MPGSTLAKANSGFTLVELVTVILILGILAVAVASRFVGAGGVAEVVDRDQALSLLRRVQMLAMQQTHSDACHRLILADTGMVVDDLSGCAAQSPGGEADLSIHFQSSAPVFSAGGSPSALPQALDFDALGNLSQCQAGCRLALANAAFCIEPQGYMHPC